MAGCTSRARRTASSTVIDCGWLPPAGCCAMATRARNRIPIVHRMLMQPSRPVRAPRAIRLSLMLEFLDESRVRAALGRIELRADLAPQLRPERVVARMDLPPDRLDLGVMAGENRTNRIALRRTQMQLVVEEVHHRVRAAPRSAGSAPERGAPTGSASGEEHGGE